MIANKFICEKCTDCAIQYQLQNIDIIDWIVFLSIILIVDKQAGHYLVGCCHQLSVHAPHTLQSRDPTNILAKWTYASVNLKYSLKYLKMSLLNIKKRSQNLLKWISTAKCRQNNKKHFRRWFHGILRGPEFDLHLPKVFIGL